MSFFVFISFRFGLLGTEIDPSSSLLHWEIFGWSFVRLFMVIDYVFMMVYVMQTIDFRKAKITNQE